jgi:RNA polymerase sigma factor (sigma-70 family)
MADVARGRMVEIDSVVSEANTFTQFFRHTVHDLHLYLRRVLQHDSDAKDIAQEALLRIWSNRTTVRPETARPLAFRIASNLALDRIRSRQRWRMTALAENLVDDHDIPAERALCANEELARAQRTIDALPVSCRTAFLLFRIEGCTHAQIARLMGISKSMVEKHVAEAVFRLSRARADDATNR